MTDLVNLSRATGCAYSRFAPSLQEPVTLDACKPSTENSHFMTIPPSKNPAAAVAEQSRLAIAVARTMASSGMSAEVSSPRSRPRQRRSTAMVSDILDAAALVLEERGLAGYNTNAVA